MIVTSFVIRIKESVVFLFKEGQAPKVANPFFDKYPVPELETESEEILLDPIVV